MTEENKKDETGEPDVEQQFDMAELAEVVRKIVEEAAPAAMKEAIKPYVEKSVTLEKYADTLVELERKKKELNTPQEFKGCEFARRARVIALGKGSAERGIWEARHGKGSNWDKDDPTLVEMSKSLTASDPAAAGGMIPPAVSAEFIELLRPMTVMRSIGRVIPMPLGSLTMRKQTASATSYYVGESANATISQGAIGAINFNFKTLVTVTPVSNSLLRFGGRDVDVFVRDDLLESQATKEDLEFLKGDGDENTPVGVDHRMAAANQVAESGTTIADVMADYTGLPKLLEAANLRLDDNNGYYVMHSSVKWGLFVTGGSTEDATFPLQAMLNAGRLFGYQVKTTTQAGVPGASTGFVYFLRGPSMLIADSLSADVSAYEGGAYHDGSNVVSGVSTDETVIKVVSQHDFNMRHDSAAARLSAVTVGA